MGEVRVHHNPASEQFGLAKPGWADDELIDLMQVRPNLISRPIVLSPLGAKLCRPSETVLDILPDPQQGAFAKEDGEGVVNAAGRRLI
jgi:arsenate reductase